MSRYVHVTAPTLRSLEEVRASLEAMGLTVEHGRRRVMLEGSIECAGEPVDLRLAAGTLDTVEDFGFVLESGRVELVCGELDRELLEHDLLAPMRAAINEGRVRQAADEAGLEVEEVQQTEGGRRLVLRRRS